MRSSLKDVLMDFKGILADFQGAVTGSDRIQCGCQPCNWCNLTAMPRTDAFEKVALRDTDTTVTAENGPMERGNFEYYDTHLSKV